MIIAPAVEPDAAAGLPASALVPRSSATQARNAALARAATLLATAYPERPRPNTGLRMETSLAPRKLTERAASTGIAAAESAPASAESPRSAAGTEALQHAQSLWNAGSYDAAMDWLQEAIAVVERSGAAGAGPAGNPVLLSLVRELARMQLAQARFSAVWDLLSRLEHQLGNAPDLWAIRGNAAQRLGRHQDSVHAYMVALQSRPDEQRWLLGAAVSMAALGKTASATDMAEKARAAGVVSQDVLAYLRQMGVVLNER